jgi:hypothetical protein
MLPSKIIDVELSTTGGIDNLGEYDIPDDTLPC